MTTENVAVLSTDIVGSTELSFRMTAEAADDVRSRHFSLLRQVIAEVGGTEVKNLGDGLMAVSSRQRAPVDALDRDPSNSSCIPIAARSPRRPSESAARHVRFFPSDLARQSAESTRRSRSAVDPDGPPMAGPRPEGVRPAAANPEPWPRTSSPRRSSLEP